MLQRRLQTLQNESVIGIIVTFLDVRERNTKAGLADLGWHLVKQSNLTNRVRFVKL